MALACSTMLVCCVINLKKNSRYQLNQSDEKTKVNRDLVVRVTSRSWRRG